jgi:hypothetical protein
MNTCLICLGILAAALLLTHAIRVIILADRAQLQADQSMDRALADQYKSDLDKATLDEIEKGRWD